MDFDFNTLGRTLIMSFKYQNDERSLQYIVNLNSLIKDQLKNQLEDSTITFNSINLYFKEEFEIEKLKIELIYLIETLDLKKSKPSVLWKLPVCIAEEFTTDIQDYFQGDQSKAMAYIHRFLSLEFRLIFYGFLPGFPYLGGLPNDMAIPRKDIPSRKTIKGSLAVGADQVGIYPQDSPGGWNVLGNCPVPMMDFSNDPPNQINSGDRIQFFQISKEEYLGVLNALEAKITHPYLNFKSYD